MDDMCQEGEVELNLKLKTFTINCSLLYVGHNTVKAQLHNSLSKRGEEQRLFCQLSLTKFKRLDDTILRKFVRIIAISNAVTNKWIIEKFS